tara:strand:+ start:761 stop:1465 length:705 start_codon:yes stop_codon:yes gene_type:complete
MTKIIGISGRKQSGKNTVANYINGKVLQGQDMVKDFKLAEDGSLEILTTDTSGAEGWGVFDVLRKDADFTYYAESNLWPFVKVYHFADYLKKISIELFDLTPQQVYGTDEDKNTDTPYGMTSREFLQYLGTDVMRKIKDTIWVDCTMKMIQQEQPSIAIIPDVRFPNEVDAIHRAGGEVLRLDRDMLNSDHSCETALDTLNYSWDNFDIIIRNHSMTLEELSRELESYPSLWSI